MLQNLSRFYNWQFAFQQAFQDSFHEAVDVEKWWSLQFVFISLTVRAGRNLDPEQSWEKLSQLVRSAVQVRIGTNDLPLHAEIALQTIIRDWPTPRQAQALESKTRELRVLRPRLSPELAGLSR